MIQEETKVTEEIARFVTEWSFDKIPDEVVEKAKWCILDWIGVTLGGSRHPIGDILCRYILNMGGKKQATVLGRNFRTSVVQAALVNGALGHVLDYDDLHVGMTGHPSSVLSPAVFAVGEYLKASGRDTILAFILGFDVGARLGMAIRPQHYEKGWHSTGTLGHFAAVAAAGKLLKLNLEQMVNAFGIAGTQASGSRQVFGSMCKPFHSGKAASNGVMAALLAKDNFTCSSSIIEGKHGFFWLTADQPDYDVLLRNLGKDFEVLQVVVKPHAACGYTHSTIDAVLALREKYALEPGEVEKIRCEVVPMALDAAGKTEVNTGLEAKFSIAFCAALALLNGKATERYFTDEQVTDPCIKDLMEKIEVVVSTELKYEDAPPAKVTVWSQRTGPVNMEVKCPRGRPRNPLSEREVVDKFSDLAINCISRERVKKVVSLVRTMEKQSDLYELTQLCKSRRIHVY